MTVTGATVVRMVLEDLRIIGQGRSPNNSDASLAFQRLQEVVDEFKTHRLYCYRVARQTFTLVAAAASRTIGPSGQFSLTPKPTSLVYAGVIPVGQSRAIAIDILTPDAWVSMPDQTETADVPSVLTLIPGEPNATLQFLPIPTTAATLVLGVPTNVTGFTDLTTEVILPEGYQYAFRSILKARVAEAFGRPMTADIARQEARAKDTLMRLNSPGSPELAPSDLGQYSAAGVSELFAGFEDD